MVDCPVNLFRAAPPALSLSNQPIMRIKYENHLLEAIGVSMLRYSQQILHNDLKPANILLDYEPSNSRPTVLLSDFGESQPIVSVLEALLVGGFSMVL